MLMLSKIFCQSFVRSTEDGGTWILVFELKSRGHITVHHHFVGSLQVERLAVIKLHLAVLHVAVVTDGEGIGATCAIVRTVVSKERDIEEIDDFLTGHITDSKSG